MLAAEILGGRPVIVRIEPQTLMFLDPDTRELLRVRPNPLTPEQALRLQGARPAGPPPRPRTEPVTVQRRVSATGVITVCRQRVSLGRIHAGRIVTVHVSEHTLAVELDDETRTVRRTTSRPVVVVKGSRPAPSPGNVNGTLGQRGTGKRSIPNRSRTMNPTTPTKPRPSVKHLLRLIRQACPETMHGTDNRRQAPARASRVGLSQRCLTALSQEMLDSGGSGGPVLYRALLLPRPTQASRVDDRHACFAGGDEGVSGRSITAPPGRPQRALASLGQAPASGVAVA